MAPCFFSCPLSELSLSCGMAVCEHHALALEAGSFLWLGVGVYFSIPTISPGVSPHLVPQAAQSGQLSRRGQDN